MTKFHGTLLLLLAISGPPLSAQSVEVRGGKGISVPRADSVADALVVLVRTAPFRRSRRPAAIPYEVAPEVVIAPTPDEDPFARLRLVGVVSGRSPVAVIDGVPGQSAARVLAPGDTVSGIRLESVTSRGALIRTAGTRRLLTLTTP